MLSCPFPWKVLPALFTYNGLQFKHMHPQDFSEKDITYAQECLRILSGMYGVLQPMDAIQPYRLEMQTRLPIAGKKDLYSYWGNRLAQYLLKEEGNSPCIINLASKEYAEGGASLSSTGELLHSNLLHRKRRQAENGIHTGENGQRLHGKLDHNPSDTYR